MCCVSLDICKKYPESLRPADFEFREPFIGLRKLIENPRLRCWGKKGLNEKWLGPDLNVET